MKKIFLLTGLILTVATAITSCVKSVVVNVDENYWLTQERGEVVYSDATCSYYVVETAYGYTVVRSWGSYRPYEGSIVYGNFGNYGVRDFYNYSSGVIIQGEVVEYDLSYVNAQYAVSYYCPYAKAAKIKEPATSDKLARPGN